MREKKLETAAVKLGEKPRCISKNTSCKPIYAKGERKSGEECHS